MSYIAKQYFKLTQYFLDSKNAYQIIFIGILAISLLIVSLMASNHTIARWSGILAGFASGSFLVGLPAVVAHFKKSPQEAGR
jgi:nitrate/nitrite transporter NarK